MRLTDVTDDLIAQIATDATHGASVGDIANANGIAPKTLYRWIEDGNRVREAVDNGRDIIDVADDLGSTIAYATKTRSIASGFERARSRARITALGHLRSLGEPIHDPGVLPARSADQKAILAWLRATSSDYRDNAPQRAQLGAPLQVSVSLSELDALPTPPYQALPDGLIDGRVVDDADVADDADPRTDDTIRHG